MDNFNHLTLFKSKKSYTQNIISVSFAIFEQNWVIFSIACNVSAFQSVLSPNFKLGQSDKTKVLIFVWNLDNDVAPPKIVSISWIFCVILSHFVTPFYYAMHIEHKQTRLLAIRKKMFSVLKTSKISKTDLPIF